MASIEASIEGHVKRITQPYHKSALTISSAHFPSQTMYNDLKNNRRFSSSEVKQHLSLHSQKDETIFLLQRNACLIGLPGSGKGFYGQMLSAVWNVPLHSTSQILRRNTTTGPLQPGISSSTSASNDVMKKMDAGQLVDCSHVSATVYNYLVQQQYEQYPDKAITSGPESTPNKNEQCLRSHRCKSFIMDGYPRTLRQIELMEEIWDSHDRSNGEHFKIHVAFHLEIPERVCIEKILGRRICRLCHKEPNVAHVVGDGFDLPPTRPPTKNCCDKYHCNPATDWYKRNDDNLTVVKERIRIHQSNEQPIIDYYKNYRNIIQFTPYCGEVDFPKIQKSIQDHLLIIDAGTLS